MNRKLYRLLALTTLAIMLMGMLPALATSVHVHQWGDYILDKAVTCTEDGAEHRICFAPNCPQPEAKEIHTIARLGHIWGPWNITAQPDCTNAGVQTHVCTRCSVSENEAIPALGHAWGTWNVTKAATCTEAGIRTRACTRCAISENEAIPILGHAWGDWHVISAPTCTLAGEQTRTCSRCQIVEKQVINPLGKDQENGHNYSPWTEFVHADCQTEGEEQRTCGNCGRVETRQTGKGKHVVKPNWYALPEPTLEKPGRKVRYCAVCNKIVESQEYGLKGYVYEMPALNFGPRVKALFTPLNTFRDRFTPLDLSVDGETVYPLVTEDGYYIANLKIIVSNGNLTVDYVMNDPETVVKSELLFLFEDPLTVTPEDLNNVSASLRYKESIPLNGKTYLVMDARLVVNYNQEHAGNRPFSDDGIYLDGMTQNEVILKEMTDWIIEGTKPI